MTTVDDRLQVAAAEVRDLAENAPLPRVATVPLVPAQRQVPRWVTAVAAAGAATVLVLISVGGVAWLRQGNGAEVADEPTPTTTLAPEVAPTTAVPPPSSTTIAPTAVSYHEILDDSAAAFYTSMVVGGDGSPVIASYVRQPAFPSGDEQPLISAIRLHRCRDPLCTDPAAVVDLAEVGWQGDGPHLTLDPSDRPVIGYHDAQDRPTIAFCDDPECESFETRQVDEAGIWVSDWAFAADGNPVHTDVIYGEPTTSNLVVCLDRFCDTRRSTRIDTGILRGGTPQIADDGSVALAYSTGQPIGPPDPEAGYDGADHYGVLKVASCADVTCPDEWVITTIDEGVNLGGLIWRSGNEIWYLAAAESIRAPTGPDDEHLAVVEKTYGKLVCLNNSCTEFEVTYLGPIEMAGSSSSPLPQSIPQTVAPDGSRIQLGHGEETLLLERFTEAGGGTWAYTTLTTIAGEGFDWAHQASLAIGESGVPIVVYGDSSGIHFITCPDLTCTPP